MKFQQALKALDQEGLAPVYAIQGSEWHLQQTFRQHLARRIEDQAGELDQVVFDLNEQTLDEVLDEAQSYSFFVDQRLIVVENVDFLNNQAKVKLTKGQEERLEAYLDDPNPASHLVFMIPADKLDNRRRLTKRFKQKTQFVEVTPLDDQEVTRYLQTYLKTSSIQLREDALEEVLKRTNYQLTKAIAEVQKLIQFASGGQPITVEVVQQLVTRSLESNVFELTNAIMARDFKGAVQIYQDLLLMKNEPIQLHALVVSQFRILIQVKLLQEQGLMQDEIAQQLGVHPYRVKLAAKSARTLALHELADLYLDLIERDYQMKTSVGQKETHFYLTLTRFMQMNQSERNSI